MKTFSPKTVEQWRQWLAAHHDSESELWLVFYKVHTKVPAYALNALREHPAALRHFEALAPSHRRQYLSWIESAKRDETKARRVKEAIRLLTAGKMLGLK